MKELYKEYLFHKHFFVNDLHVDADTETSGVQNVQSDSRFETLFALANLFNIRITSGEKLLTPDMIRFASKELGENVPQPFYEGFPESVRALSPDRLLFDQLLHYTRTYGFGDFSEGGHSVFEEKMERTAFKEASSIKDFSVITEDEALVKLEEMVSGLLAGTRPLSDSQYQLVKEFIVDRGFTPYSIASKNTAVKLLLDTRDLKLAGGLYMSDVIRLTDEMNFLLYGNEDMTKLNLKNQDRRFITALINELFRVGRVDLRSCYEKKKLWNGLLHHIHYRAISEEAQAFVNAMRGRGNESVYSEFEAAMKKRRILEAADILKKGKGTSAVLRNLNYLISRCESGEALDNLLDTLESGNVIILLQLLLRYSGTQGTGARTFAFTKHNLLKVHTETEEEQSSRRSMITAGQTAALKTKIMSMLKAALKDKLGRVYIDPDMKRYALPLQESTSQGGFGVLTRGSRLPVPDCRVIRGFTYWEKVNDIDLSVFGITEKGEAKEFSWRTMASNQSPAITYSGDVTNGFNGGSEYFDVDIEEFRKTYPDIRYIIFCDNVYSGLNFESCFCKAGYMLRDKVGSGEIYEPKTVQSSFLVNCASTFAYLFGLDLNTMEFVWLNMARSGSVAVAGTTDMSFLLDHFHTTEIINVYSFFEMMASEITEDPANAEVIVTDKETESREGQLLIREYDTEKMIALMN